MFSKSTQLRDSSSLKSFCKFIYSKILNSLVGLTCRTNDEKSHELNLNNRQGGMRGNSPVQSFIIIAITILISLQNVNAQWTILNSGTTNEIWGMQFINSNTGFLVGAGGLIKKTTNAGNNWTTSTGTGFNVQRDIFMWVGNAWGVSCGHSGALRTTNEGASWYTVLSTGAYYAMDIMWSGNTLYCVGQGMSYAKAVNNYGSSFTTGTFSVPGTTGFDIYGIDITNNVTPTPIWICGSSANNGGVNTPKICRSTDGGSNFSIMLNLPAGTFTGASLNDVAFSGFTGFACSSNGRILRTTNHGTAWDTTYLGNYDLRQITFKNSTTAFVCGSNGQVFYTVNSGANWAPLGSTGTTNNLRCIESEYYSGNYLWSAGVNGTLVRTEAFLDEVNVSGAVSGNGNYINLSSALSAINSASQTGANITVTINRNTTEPSTGVILNQGNWSSLTIRPAAGSGKTISGNMNSGVPLIDFNGADNVTIDGINSGGTSLTLSNSSVSNAAGSSTIRFQNDAVNNRIVNCNVLGSTLTNFSNACANILFAGNAVSTGNDNNVISDCNIGPAGSGLPACAVYFSGTTMNETLNNSGDTIRNCNIYDYFSANIHSVGVMVSAGNNSVAILNNKLFQTASRTILTSSVDHHAIQINNPSGNNFSVKGNTIGFSSSSGTGYYQLQGASNSNFYGMYINTGTTSPTVISNNSISNIQIGGANAGAYMIRISEGMVSVDSNLIGSMTQTNAITSYSTNSFPQFFGINYTGSANSGFNINSIGGLSATSPTSSVIAIRLSGSGNSVINCVDNKIGGDTANSIQSSSTGLSSSMSGINISNFSGNSVYNVLNNTIQNVTTQLYGTSSNTQTTGIYVQLITGSFSVSKNTIRYLKNTNISQQAGVNGIYVYSGTGAVNANYIHSMKAAGVTSSVSGIYCFNAAADFTNNMISLGYDETGADVTTGCSIYGIAEINTTGNRFFYNSVYLGGSPSNGSSNTFSFYSIVTNSSRVLANNIFYNARSNNGSTGKHYSISLGGSSPNPPGLSSNYNDLFANGNGGVLGYFNNSDAADLNSWKTASGKDSNSVSANPKFTSHINLHIDSTVQSAAGNAGINIPGFTNDYDNDLRNVSTPDIGADEFNSNITSEALNFDGMNDQVALPNSLTQTLTSPAVTEFTIEYWFRGSNIQSAVRFQVSSSAYIVAGWGNLSNQKHIISSDGGITGGVKVGNVYDGKWHHVAMTWKRNTTGGFRSYLDGALVEAKNAADVNLPGLTSGGFLGSQGYNNSEYMNGSLDEVRIWTRALSQTEIASNRFHEINSASGLLASYHFNQGIAFGNNSGVTSLTDASGNNFSGTLSNFALNGGSSNWIEPGPGFCTPYVEANVTGNGITINDGDISPAVNDYTDFGSVNSGLTVLRTFTIYNSGTDSMNAGNPVISGADSVHFIPGSITPAGKIPPGGASTFTVTFAPGNSGVKNVIVHIPNNDCDEYDYDFAIRGTANAATAQVLNFDGINDNVVLPVSLSQSLTSPGNTELTIEYWFKGTYIQSAVRFQQTGGNWIVAGWGAPGNEKHLISTEGGTNGISVGAGVTDGNWHHVAMTWKRNTVNGFRSYLDGTLIEQRNSSDAALPPISVSGYIGRYNSGSGEYTQGTIDEVRIWKRQLSQNEIAANRFIEINSGDGLLASYHFNHGMAGEDNSGDTTLADATGNNFSGTLVNFTLSGLSSNWLSPGPFACAQLAEIDVKGNSTSINDGDSAASISDHTDFGSVAADTSITQSFAIRNSGTQSLIAGTISVTGADASKFSVSQLTPPGSIAAGDSAAFNITFTPAGSGTMNAFVHIPTNDCDEGDFDFAVKGTGFSSHSVNITAIVEGYYNASTAMQNKSDTMKAYLHSNVPPYNAVDSSATVIDSVSHSGVFLFLNALPGNYFIKLSHRNSIDTWSAAAQNISGSSSYNFTTGSTQAYGGNMKQVGNSPVRFAVYGGDVNKDGTVDLTDIVNIFNDANAFISGYIATDVTGDDFVDLSDVTLAFNNSNAFVSVSEP